MFNLKIGKEEESALQIIEGLNNHRIIVEYPKRYKINMKNPLNKIKVRLFKTGVIVYLDDPAYSVNFGKINKKGYRSALGINHSKDLTITVRSSDRKRGMKTYFYEK